jgi:ATP-dependent DNA helicase RecG
MAFWFPDPQAERTIHPGASMSDGDLLLSLPVERFRGVGPQLVAKLEKLKLRCCRDLLLHLPLRYQDRTQVVRLNALQPGSEVLTAGRVEHCEVVPGRRRRLVCRLGDGGASLSLVFFHFSPALERRLVPGSHWQCFGDVRQGLYGPEMVHPELSLGEGAEPDRSGRPATLTPVYPATLTPVYPATDGVHQTLLRRLIGQALSLVSDRLPDPVQTVLDQETRPGTWPTLLEALRVVHAPVVTADTASLLQGSHPAARRLALEELLAHHLSLRVLRQTLRSEASAPRLIGDPAQRDALLAALPFSLTGAQRRVDAELAIDLACTRPMLRLLQGDVGSGKTVVAALAALRAVGSGWQVAVMAPTELLAEQHYRTFRKWLDPLGLGVAWLSGRLTAATRRAALAAITGGEADVVIGTHALFQTQVQFARLGLVVVDEQHRFGVHQRLALRDKGLTAGPLSADGQGAAVPDAGQVPHQLVMTATPIPRTLAMTAYADLDVSVIDELPPGRSPITTVVMSEQRRDDVVAAVARACDEGRQVYWVCTLIDESEQLQAQTASDTAVQLAEALPGLRIGLVHGRMKPPDKESVMASFAGGALQLLVATTVIEVGVDVPNASLMVIDNAERLGLAQLHQLRGRVGRGEAASVCILMYRPPLSQTARQRLEVIRGSQDGFVIAERDLLIRGPGELLGTRQTGDWGFRACDLSRDSDLLELVQRLSERLLSGAPTLAAAFARRWVGDAVRYGGV